MMRDNDSIGAGIRLQETDVEKFNPFGIVSADGSVQSIHQDEIPERPFLNCLVDYTGRQFACMCGDCLDTSNCFKKESEQSDLHFQQLEFHPQDKKVFIGEIFPDLLRLMVSLPLDALREYRFSVNHRFIRQDRKSSEFLLEGVFARNETSRYPVLYPKVFTELGEIKKDNSMILTVYKYDGNKGFLKLYSKEYCSKDDSLLSKREVEIIRLCFEGLTSKMIGEKLHISAFTVKNHKRNCMVKTSTRNIAELVHLCLRSNWL